MKKFFTFAAWAFFTVTALAQTVVDAKYFQQRHDTLFFQDAKGYVYQKMSSSLVGVAPGGRYDGDVAIPDVIRCGGVEYQVTSVRRGAFRNSTARSVTLPRLVTLVGTDAFRGSKSLERVNYGPNTRVEVRSFWGCPKLQLDEDLPVKFAFTEPSPHAYLPCDSVDENLKRYTWLAFKHHHNGVDFENWMNMDKEEAMPCWCSKVKSIKGARYTLRDASFVPTMYRGYMEKFPDVLLMPNDYVGTHEFVQYTRYAFGENPTPMPASFVKAMEKKYGRSACYSYQAAKVMNAAEQVAVTEFHVTNHEAMVVISWVKNGKEAASYVMTAKAENDESESVWNVDDDGSYGIPAIISITKDEKGRVDIFLDHEAPESANYMQLREFDGKLLLNQDEQYYRWVDAPDL